MSLGGGSPPPAPDYVGAAQVTAAGNADAARVAAKANRVNQYTPYGSQVFTNGIDGDPDKWAVNQTLTPAGQQQFDQNQRINTGLNSIAEQGLGYVQNTLNKPFDIGGAPQLNTYVHQGNIQGSVDQNTGMEGWDKATQAILSRVNPELDRQQAGLDNKLANQGIMQGSEAWGNAQNQFGQQRNDALTQAVLAGATRQNDMFGQDLAAGNFANTAQGQKFAQDQSNANLGNQSRNQYIQEQQFLRNEPLNMLNSLRTAAPLTTPSFQSWGNQGQTAGADILGATQAGYNANLANYNASQAGNNGLMSGLFGLGGAVLGGPAGSAGANLISKWL